MRARQTHHYAHQSLPQQPVQQRPPAQQPAAPNNVVLPSKPSAEDILAQLEKLGKLRDAGIVSEEEFQSKKTEMLRRL